MKFACALVAQEPGGDHRVAVCMVEAATRDEADGKAMRIVRKHYPPDRGFHNHFVWTCPESNVLDPDGEVMAFTPGP